MYKRQEQLVEGFRVAALAHHVADNKHGVVVQRTDLTKDRSLFVAKAPPVEVGKQQYAVSFQVFRQTDHGHFRLVHRQAVALHQHHDDQQQGHRRQKHRPEGEVSLPAKEPYGAALPRAALG